MIEEVDVSESYGFSIDPSDKPILQRAQDLTAAFPGKVMLEEDDPVVGRMLVLGRSDEQPLPTEMLEAVMAWVKTGQGARPDLSTLPEIAPEEMVSRN